MLEFKLGCYKEAQRSCTSFGVISASKIRNPLQRKQSQHQKSKSPLKDYISIEENTQI